MFVGSTQVCAAAATAQGDVAEAEGALSPRSGPLVEALEYPPGVDKAPGECGALRNESF